MRICQRPRCRFEFGKGCLKRLTAHQVLAHDADWRRLSPDVAVGITWTAPVDLTVE